MQINIEKHTSMIISKDNKESINVNDKQIAKVTGDKYWWVTIGKEEIQIRKGNASVGEVTPLKHISGREGNYVGNHDRLN